MNGKHLCLTDMNSSCLTGTNSQSLSVRRTMDMQEYNSPVYGLHGSVSLLRSDIDHAEFRDTCGLEGNRPVGDAGVDDKGSVVPQWG